MGIQREVTIGNCRLILGDMREVLPQLDVRAKMVMSALIWRMGKYEQHDAGIRDLTRAARRHVTHVQSAWLSDRQARAAERRQL
ncbi:hypothetical protein GN241_11115 [Rhodobacteraceae bacterium IMCC1335]